MQSEFGEETIIGAEEFQAQLAQYVRMELAGLDADATYPDVTFLITTSELWLTAYYQEFHRQGMLIPWMELQHIPRHPRIAAILDQAFSLQINSETAPTDWIERVIEKGRAWVERATGRWRIAEIALPSFYLDQMPQSATVGMLDATKPSEASIFRTLYLNPADATFEVILTVAPDPTASDQYQVEATITLFERIGDFSNVQMLLFWGDIVRMATTDQAGKAFFANLPSDALTAMNLRIALPDKKLE